MIHQSVTLGRRPTLSAIGAAIRAPNRVPMESYICQLELDLVRQEPYQSYDQSRPDVGEIVGTIRMLLAETLEEVWHFYKNQYSVLDGRRRCLTQKPRNLPGVITEAVGISQRVTIAFYIPNTYINPPIEMRMPIRKDLPVTRGSGL